VIREIAASLVEHAFFPQLRRGLGPLNGQRSKQEIFDELFSLFPFTQIIETGTYRGTTTKHLATKYGAPVLTAEINPRYYYFSRLHLLFCRNVTQFLGSSISLLEKLGADSSATSQFTLFYLDAHWRDYLPLRDELAIIFTRWPKCVVVVDDFQVPQDAGYGFDDYGKDMTLNFEYIAPVVKRFEVLVTYPLRRSDQDTGVPRGTIVLFRRECAPDKATATLRLAR
jgi:predicted O-methyltransferase YrrM